MSKIGKLPDYYMDSEKTLTRCKNILKKSGLAYFVSVQQPFEDEKTGYILTGGEIGKGKFSHLLVWKAVIYLLRRVELEKRIEMFQWAFGYVGLENYEIRQKEKEQDK